MVAIVKKLQDCHLLKYLAMENPFAIHNYASRNYDWLDPLGTPSKDNQGTKISHVIFLGLFFKIFS
jgi:hypothetical protein